MLYQLFSAAAPSSARGFCAPHGTTLASRLACASLVLASVAIAGCRNRGGSDASGEGTTPAEDEVLSSMDDRVRCASLGPVTEGVDVNNDGRADIQHHTDGGRTLCVEIDMNFDGRVDVTRFFEADGTTVLREEHDFDFDGRLDEITYFSGGAIVRKELDTTFDHRVDTWMWCENGFVSRAQRDRRNRGEADVWETYAEGMLSEARYDDNHDGRVEKWEIFRNGSLVEVRFDLDNNGEADRNDPVHPDDAGPPEERLRCDANATVQTPETAGGDAPAPAQPAPPPATDGDTSETTFVPDPEDAP
jgi:hypothetical protein